MQAKIKIDTASKYRYLMFNELIFVKSQATQPAKKAIELSLIYLRLVIVVNFMFFDMAKI